MKMAHGVAKVCRQLTRATRFPTVHGGDQLVSIAKAHRNPVRAAVLVLDVVLTAAIISDTW